MTKKNLINIIDSLIKSEGYSRKGSEWRKDCGDVVAVLTLQRSRWSNQYYISLRSILKELLSIEKLSHHISLRIESLVGGNIDEALDLENEITDNVREKDIKKIITSIIPTLKKLETFDSIKKLVNQYGNAVMITKMARAFLGIQTND